MTRQQMARLIDHTQLRAVATQSDIVRLCTEARANRFATVSVNPVWTSFCAKELSGSGVGISPTVGFPLGANTARMKVEEAREAVKNGATELDMVINIGALKSGYPQYVEQEVAAVVKAVPECPIKVILETGYLTDEEKIIVCEICLNVGAAFVKTSTGFGSRGASVDDIRLIRQVVGKKLGIKAAGGIRTYRDAMVLVEAGATRIGTSAGVDILAEMPQTAS